jgi:hypothetical protein
MKRSLKDGSGYLEIDHSNSPGLSEADIPSALRDTTIVVPKNTKFESDVQMCSHCQKAVVLNPMRVRPRGYCPKCDHYICDSCEAIRAKAGCIPFKQVLDQVGG